MNAPLTPVERLRYRVDLLEQIVGLSVEYDPEAAQALHLSAQEITILRLLLKARMVSREQMFLALWGENRDGGPDCGEKILHLLICRLRKKLGLHGVVIKTAYGQGYWLTDPSKEIVRRLLGMEGGDG